MIYDIYVFLAGWFEEVVWTGGCSQWRGSDFIFETPVLTDCMNATKTLISSPGVSFWDLGNNGQDIAE